MSGRAKEKTLRAKLRAIGCTARIKAHVDEYSEVRLFVAKGRRGDMKRFAVGASRPEALERLLQSMSKRGAFLDEPNAQRWLKEIRKKHPDWIARLKEAGC